jgi:hypothetical protein
MYDDVVDLFRWFQLGCRVQINSEWHRVARGDLEAGVGGSRSTWRRLLMGGYLLE